MFKQSRLIFSQGKTLYNNASVGTIVSNQSLVLQSVTRARAGLYTCVGSNQEGDGESNPVYLDVKCKLGCISCSSCKKIYMFKQSRLIFSQGKTLYNNASVGTIVSNQSLVLQSVTRARAGLYTCVGSNQEGDGESNPVYLDVKFAPVCKPGQQKVHGVARQEAARILCELEANPQDGILFTWKFNNSAEVIDIPAAHFTTDRARSTASYTPMTELDYGTLLCWGRNELGLQKAPCVFHVIPAGKPDGLQNCSIVNQTAESLHVECTDGFDGGLPQEFVMEVYDAATQALVSNVTSKAPVFTVTGLESGLGFDIALPKPPEKCRILQQTVSSLRVGCTSTVHDLSATYMLQVYDAETRRLVASATSETAAMLEITELPSDCHGLVLSVRTVTAQATSDAVSIYTILPQPREQRRGGKAGT
ncbi:hypothetical protein C0J52_11657 [Blattella germanica]|nr:hypothetical protein C0J52_11657 [Blattella germanica]